MQKSILWIFVVAAFGVSHCDYTDDSMEDESASVEKESKCGGELHNTGYRMSVKGWFYDNRRGQCRHVIFGDNHWDNRRNQFQTLSDCRKTCRDKVPSFCFATPQANKRTNSYPMFTYNATHGVCVSISAENNPPKTNVFRSEKKCNETCRDPDLGPCGPSAVTPCGDENGKTRFSFNADTQTCGRHACGPFTTLENCYERCGKFVQVKCNIQNITSRICDTQETRYWYNLDLKKCVSMTGCEDDTTNFKTAEECWKTCSRGSRCLKDPVKGRFPLKLTSYYYYDVKHNTCNTTRLFWSRTSNKNLFKNLEDCIKVCKA